MTPCTRPPSPDWLEEHWETWGREFAKRRDEDSQHRFNWRTWQGKPLNIRLLPLLSEMTDSHCAYCDWFPMDTGTDPTIDHFHPKAHFPQLAYAWENLYLCCRQCQEKDDNRFTEELLRPDEPGYGFERFFIYKYANGEICPNPAATEKEQQRARLTIDIFKLNSRGRPQARKRELKRFRERFHESVPEDRDEWISESPFRYLLCEESGDMFANIPHV
ncbi:MAG: TIGR02646 family protein [Gammaproteobacteria bacterium]|nr:TIGR02646 family protein [Gammaproteobacteria bacterium]NNJ83799.1 TIGR02646 family protein [Gammaproteobacteria bacterium]